jgi:hypothetical protein
LRSPVDDLVAAVRAVVPRPIGVVGATIVRSIRSVRSFSGTARALAIARSIGAFPFTRAIGALGTFAFTGSAGPVGTIRALALGNARSVRSLGTAGPLSWSAGNFALGNTGSVWARRSFASGASRSFDLRTIDSGPRRARSGPRSHVWLNRSGDADEVADVTRRRTTATC